MKIIQVILVTVIAATLAVVGCSKKSSVDTAPLEQSFKSAEGATKTSADSAVASIKNADYSSAMAELQKLAKDAKLTPDQKQAVTDVLAQIQKAIADTTNKAAGDANKAATDLQKSLPK